MTPLLSRRAALLGSAATLAAYSVGPAEADPAGRPDVVKRRIIALFDGDIEKTLLLTNVHSLAAMPLEWLGLTLEYHDIRDELPLVWADPSIRGVLTWFVEPNIGNFPAYVSWMERVSRSGLRIVQIGDAAPKSGSIAAATLDALKRRLFACFGVRMSGQWSSLTLGDRIAERNTATTEFEHRFDTGLPPYELYGPAREDATSWLVVTRADQARSQSHLVMVSSAGGFIAPGYAVGADPMTGVKQWFVDPFAFFAAAFATDDLPAADTTTLCGRRIYYSHIDGDGWRSVSTVRAPGRAPATNAEIVLQTVVAANPDLPVTVAPIAAEMDPAFAGDLRAIASARALFKLDHVEAATHTYTHPFRWSFFENYSASAEAPYQDVYAAAASGRSIVVEATVPSAAAAGCCGRALRTPNSPPRAFGGRPFDLAQEVGGAVKLIDAIGAPAGKRVRLLQWPGDCAPFPAALRRVADAGLLNINGGDTRCDDEFPSVSAVAPLGFRRNGLTQIYASNSSEELYTDLWTDRFFGFRDLPITWDRTGAPRRLKPMNLYYHMYSGERRASLDALNSNIAALRARGDYIGIFASDFAALAGGFLSVSFRRESSSTWRVLERGSLQTIRFANAATRMVDLARSSGVLGERVSNGELYVALDPAIPEPVIALAPRADAAPMRPVLVSSSWVVSEFSHEANRFSFVAQGFGRGELEWRVAPGRSWTAAMSGQRVESRSSIDGMLRLELPALAIKPATITVTTQI